MAALQWLLRLAAVVLVAAMQQAASALPLTAVPLLPARRLQPLPGHAICDFHNNTQLVDPGGKYTRGPSTAHSPQECCDICGRDDECQGAVLYGEGCFTKTKVFPGVPQTPPPGVALVACVYKSWSPSPSPSPPSPPSPPPHGTAVIGSKAAADPPKPQLPGAYSVVWDLTEGTAGSMVVVATGTTDVDDAGQGKQRDVQTMKRKSDLHPGLNFYSVIDSISDYVTGDRWTHTCSNQTIAEVCSCQHSALSGSIPYIDPAGWSYIGKVIGIDGKTLTRWQVTPAIIWTLTSGAKPNLLMDASESGGADLAEQAFRDYVLKSPAPSRWVVPKAWNCSKV